MADLRISQVLPTVKCSSCNQPVHVRALADHVCDRAPPVPALPPMIDTSPAIVRKQSQDNGYLSSGSPLSGSKNMFFWPRQTKKSPISPAKEHAITAYSPVDPHPDQQPRFPFTHDQRLDLESRSPLSPVSPVSPLSPSSHFPILKNSTSPAPNSNNPLSPSRSTSSREQSPITPGPGSAYPFREMRHDKSQCARCKRELAANAQVVHAGTQAYHTQCFSCFLCRRRLDPRQQPHIFENRVYCETDFNIVIKRPTCGGCHHPIEPHVRPTKALGRYYHPEHIRCHHCHKPVDPDTTGLVERKGKIFCRPDFNLLYLPKCQACGKAVEKEAVSSADGKLKGKWHVHCFRCHLCRCEFPNHSFYVYNNAPYCRRDYHKMNGSLCRKCDQPVEGRCAKTAEGWRLHPQCFTCHVCKCEIQDVYYVHENRIYCPQDRLLRSEKRHTFFQQI